MKRVVRRGWVLSVLFALWVSMGGVEVAGAGEGSSGTGSAASLPSDPPVRAIGKGVFAIGELRFDSNEKTLTVPATVHMREGLIEYGLVHETGKVHESLLRTAVSPKRIHVAALLLGAEKTPVVIPEDGEKEANPGQPIYEPSAVGEGDGFPGSRAQIWVVPQGSSEEDRRPLEEWIWHEEKEQKMERTGWIYNSSRILYGHFMAEREGSIVSLIADPNALVNSRHPDQSNDEIWRPNAEALPPEETQVDVIIELLSQEETTK